MRERTYAPDIFGRGRPVLVTALAVLLLGTLSASATPVPIGGGWMAQFEQGFENFVGIVTDEIGDDAIVIQIIKDFTSPVFEDERGDPIYIEFFVDPESTSHVSDIVLTDEKITNSTGAAWFDFHMALSWNIADPCGAYVGFRPDHLFAPDVPLHNPFTAVEFDADPIFNQGLAYAGAATPTRMNFSQGVVPAGAQFNPGRAGSGDNYVTIITDMQPGGDSFWLKEWPTVPEPTATVLLALGAGALLRRRKTALGR